MSRRIAVGAVTALVAVGVLTAAAVLVLGDDDGADPTLAVLSTRGRAIEMALPERLGPSGRLTGEAILVAERGGFRFLRMPRTDGSSSWGTTERRSGLWH